MLDTPKALVCDDLSAAVGEPFLLPSLTIEPAAPLRVERKLARRGVTLIEAVLFISVALGLIVGGLVFYQQASRASTHQAVVRQLQVVQGELRALYQVSNWDRIVSNDPNSNVVPTLIAMGAVPREMVSTTHANQIRLAYGGQLQVSCHIPEGDMAVS